MSCVTHTREGLVFISVLPPPFPGFWALPLFLVPCPCAPPPVLLSPVSSASPPREPATGQDMAISSAYTGSACLCWCFSVTCTACPTPWTSWSHLFSCPLWGRGEACWKYTSLGPALPSTLRGAEAGSMGSLPPSQEPWAVYCSHLTSRSLSEVPGAS